MMQNNKKKGQVKSWLEEGVNIVQNESLSYSAMEQKGKGWNSIQDDIAFSDISPPWKWMLITLWNLTYLQASTGKKKKNPCFF